jgi:DNA-binding NarL/FixJ family response regulator
MAMAAHEWTTQQVAPARPADDRTRVLIVEDHPLVRAVVRAACEASDALDVVGEAHGPGALDACERLLPDVIVLDPAVSDSSAIGIVQRLRERAVPPRILVLVDSAAEAAVLPWLRLRVDGLLAKSSGVRAIARAIEAVADGDRVLAPDQHSRAVTELGHLVRAARAGTRPPPSSLTARELEVLRLLARGLTIRQVATRTGISPRTVETHVTKLYRKLEVRTRMQAIARAAALGHIDVGAPGVP